MKANKKFEWVVPILVSIIEKYDVKKGGEFFEYLKLMFVNLG